MRRLPHFTGFQMRMVATAILIVSLFSIWPYMHVSFLYAWNMIGDRPLTFVSAELALMGADGDDYEREIKRALSDGDDDLASSMLSLARQRGLVIDPQVLTAVEQASRFSFRKSAMEVWKGATGGSAETPLAFASSVVVDMTVVGDVRDLYDEYSRYPNYDPLTVGLAAAGVASAGFAAASAMDALPIKAGVSLLKSAKKAGRLTKGLENDLKRMTADSVRSEEFWRVMRSSREMDIKGASEGVARIINQKSLSEISHVSAAVGTIASQQGYRGVIDGLKISNSLDELKKVEVLSEHYGRSFRAVSRFLFKTGTLSLSVVGFLSALGWYVVAVGLWILCLLAYLVEFTVYLIDLARHRAKSLI